MDHWNTYFTIFQNNMLILLYHKNLSQDFP